MTAKQRRFSKASLADFGELLKFWGAIDVPPSLTQSEKGTYEAQIRAVPASARKAALEALKRQYDEVKDDLNSTRSRAGNLMAATGVISGVVALTAGFTTLFQAQAWVAYVGLLLTAVVIYCAVATTFLAIRAQQVDFWGQAEVHPVQMSSAHTYEIKYTTSLYVAWRNNLSRLRVPVGYLRDAQVYFRALVIALGLLVLLTIGGDVSNPAPSRISPAHGHASPAPTASQVRAGASGAAVNVAVFVTPTANSPLWKAWARQQAIDRGGQA